MAGTLLGKPAQVRSDYRCTIERVSQSDDDFSTLELLRKGYVGKQFTIERRTGLMAGALKNCLLSRIGGSFSAPVMSRGCGRGPLQWL